MTDNMIYLAEDDHTLANVLVQVLRDEFGCDCRAFHDGLEAYSGVVADPPSLLILDVLLPTVNGLAVARLLKFHEAYQNIPILVMSSMPEAELRGPAADVHADSVLAKPFDTDLFLETVASLLPRKAASAEGGNAVVGGTR